MSSDDATLQKIYNELISMRHHQEEDKFLSKIDAIFTVLVSFMIFMSGLIINNSVNQDKLNVPLLFYGLAAISVFAIVLIGQFIAILHDNISLRFFYWAILINGVVQIVAQAWTMYCMAAINSFIGELLWWPAEILSMVFIIYGMLKLEESFFGKFSEERKISALPGMRLFNQHLDRPGHPNSRLFRSMYFLLMWMGVAIIIRLSQAPVITSLFLS